jgi:aldose 1-epimerase
MDEAALPSGSQWTISHGEQQAVVVEVGGGLRRWRVGDADLVDGYEADELCVGGAGQVLAPWPNRIRDGWYTFEGEEHQLPLSEPETHTALHGLVRWLPWRLVAADRTSVTCECLLPAQTGYPWSLSLRTTWSLSDGGLAAEHWATNLSDRPAPFGFSVHPYLRVPGVPVSDLRLRVPGRARLLTDTRLLPIGAAKVDGTDWDFTTPRPIGGQVIDTAFGSVIPDPDGGSSVTLTSPNGTGVRFWADQSFRWWQVFTSDTLAAERKRRSVAVEPMTCPPDAFRSGKDVIVLQPGDTWHGAWTLSPI